MPTAAPVQSAQGTAAVPVGRISSDSIPAGGFTPGAILADRYRIIGLLGRGGMGEVYRADDLKLGQPVALKFLPRALASDPVRRERFFAEVRITRQLAHPNICRVYDIAEFQGQHFLSMEYIDGEDLASLIKRIGRLSDEKALEIARQLLAGLAAAHDRGVLHRDLKPANIMIDGHGRVRITDFGLAIAAGQEEQTAEVLGTPAYMAPEQFAGKGASVRSDIYSLGLVLYEIYCGRKAFTAGTIAELREQKEAHTPSAPSEIRTGFDPIVERLIMRCLERDPRARPASVAQLAAALPGGDPLAAALAAGETPSPEMVAASGLKEGLRPAVAVALLVFVILGSLAVAAMNARTQLIQRVRPTKTPDALAERAREVIRKAGYTDAPADSASGFYYYDDFIRHIQDTDKSRNRWNKLNTFTAIGFWLRQSPRPLERESFNFGAGFGEAMLSGSPLQFSGDVLVRLDSEGRLRTLEAMPPQVIPSTEPPSPPDWASIFSEAGFDLSKWTPVQPQRNPLYLADTLAAWQGKLPEAEVQVRIEAAAYRGKPVSFEIVGPWTRPTRAVPFAVQTGQKISNAIGALLLVAVMGGGVFFARRNLRMGRGDRRGANRVALFACALFTIAWLLTEHHVATFWELGLFIMFASLTLFSVGLLWVLYIALEPYVRRRWPQVLVSWSRLLSGEWLDPLVGRDVLIGCAAAVALSCLSRIQSLAPSWFAYPEAPLAQTPIDGFAGTGSFISTLLESGLGFSGLFLSFGFLFLFFFLRILLRRNWAAAVVWVFLLNTDVFTSEAPWIDGAMGVVVGLLILFVLMRFGLVALVAMLLISEIFFIYPITFQTSAWYAGAGYAALLVVVAVSLYGFRISLGGRRLFDLSGVED